MTEAIVLPPHQIRLSYRSLLLNGLQMTALICLISQCVISQEYENLISTFLVFLSSSAMFQYLWRSDAMTDHPLSSLALLGFTASSQFVALLTQTLDGQPFVEYLRAPELTFSVLAVAHVSAIAAHFVFRHFTPLSGSSAFIGEKILGTLSLHRIPMPIALWMMGGAGLVALLAGGGAMGDVGGKLLAGFLFLLWMPFLIPLYHHMLGEDYCTLKVHLPLLLGYALCILLAAMAKNSRAMMFIGPIQLGMIYLLYRCRGQQKVDRIFLLWAVGGTLALALITPQLADLMKAMELVRGQRTDVSKSELLKETWIAFLDKTRLQQYRDSEMEKLTTDLYDEMYLQNPMLARFTETKFHDNMLYFSQFLDAEATTAILNYQVDRVIALVPQNILDMLDVRFDKYSIQYANGDLYLNQAIGWPLGGYVTGSMWADLYVLAGPWFPLATMLVLVLSFIALDAFTRFGPGLFISPAALCSVYSIYLYGIGAESLGAKIGQITRTNLQLIVLYAVTLAVLRVGLMFLNRPLFWSPAKTSDNMLL